MDTNNSRRSFLKLMGGLGAFGVLSAIPKQAHAWVALVGTWRVRCLNGHDNMVAGFTRDHRCETCGIMSVSEGSAWVVCPRCGNVDHVDGVTRQHECDRCGAQCRYGS